jgi:hypothetical protein
VRPFSAEYFQILAARGRRGDRSENAKTEMADKHTCHNRSYNRFTGIVEMKKAIVFIVLSCFLMQHVPASLNIAGVALCHSPVLSALFDPFSLINNASQEENPLTAEYRAPLKPAHAPLENIAIVQEFHSLVRIVSQTGSAQLNGSEACAWNLFANADPSPPRVPWDAGGGGWLFMLLAYVVLLHRSNLPWRISISGNCFVRPDPSTCSGPGFFFV